MLILLTRALDGEVYCHLLFIWLHTALSMNVSNRGKAFGNHCDNESHIITANITMCLLTWRDFSASCTIKLSRTVGQDSMSNLLTYNSYVCAKISNFVAYLMKVRWTPNDLWVPEQSIHRNTPYVMLAQLGFLAEQSKHTWGDKS